MYVYIKQVFNVSFRGYGWKWTCSESCINEGQNVFSLFELDKSMNYHRRESAVKVTEISGNAGEIDY